MHLDGNYMKHISSSSSYDIELIVYYFLPASHYDFEPSKACRLALSSSRDCSVRLWDLDSSKELRSIYTFNPVTAMAFVGDISCAVTGSGKSIIAGW